MMSFRDLRRSAAFAVALAGLHSLSVPASALIPHVSPLEIEQATPDGSQLWVSVRAHASVPPGELLELRLLDAEQQVVSMTRFTPIPGTSSSVLLDGQFPQIPARGWQHTLELVSVGSQVVQRLGVRLGLECPGHTPICHLTARLGVTMNGAVDAATDAFESPVDFGALAANEPDLRAEVFETGLDVMLQQASSESPCTCFYTASVWPSGGATHSIIKTELSGLNVALTGYRTVEVQTNDRLRLSHSTERQVEVGFQCAQISSVFTAALATSSGMLNIPLPTLVPCESSCKAPVEWSLVDAYEKAVLVSEGWARAEMSYELDWRLGSAGLQPAATISRSWNAFGTMLSPPRVHEQLSPLPTGTATAVAPSLASLRASSSVEVRNWSAYDLPQGQMSAGATLKAVGTSACAAPAEILVQPTLHPAGATPVTLVLDTGPEEEDP